MNYRDFTLGDWIGHISGVIEDETTLDGNEMRDLVEFLTTMQEPKTNILDKLRAEIKSLKRFEIRGEVTPLVNVDRVLEIIDKAESEVDNGNDD